MRKTFVVVPIVLLVGLPLAVAVVSEKETVGVETNSAIHSDVPLDTFLTLSDPAEEPETRLAALAEIGEKWRPGYAVMMLESARYARDRRTGNTILGFLSEQTGKSYGRNLNDWYRWVWNQDFELHSQYAEFKKKLYARIDPRFSEYFSGDYRTKIRLDEVRWGGVRRDGIPPLKDPETLAASEATFLADSDVVFGVEFDGQARAYPKRILAWHEMVKDHVGGQSINGVYCTLCGSMIVYRTEFEGKHHELGTSGFLYRSNKLMYDHETKSMWSTLKGEPVIGPLVGSGIKLEPLFVVTSTWGDWKKMHPDTDVLSLNTGFRRNYGEGVAYHDYFATDELMFTVPEQDDRLLNKDEILVVRVQDQAPLAIAAKFLRNHPVYQDRLGEQGVVVITDSSGANRVYEDGGLEFEPGEQDASVRSADGVTWRVREDGLH
ncbi:MAG: DUF3179 domain-containing (seleno)protein, partial [Planctomycetota bacterium]